VRAVAEAKKPLFCEKPLASTLEDTKKLVQTIKKAGIKCQIGFHRRFDPEFAEGERLIREGNIGKPVFVGGYSRDPFPPPPTSCDPSKGGGLFFDLMLHDFDLARFLVNDDVDRVFADESNLVVDGKGIHRFSDNATAHLRFKNGALAHFHASWHAWYGYDIRTEVHGSEGTILMGGFNSHEITMCLKDKGITKPKTFQTVGKIPHFMYRFKEAYIQEMIGFVECVLDDKPPIVNEDDALAAFQIAIAADRSASERKPVSVDEI
jgi:scyllo-inositol 2-dehydrogenase (NAD+)